jgi:hypothetical protein
MISCTEAHMTDTVVVPADQIELLIKTVGAMHQELTALRTEFRAYREAEEAKQRLQHMIDEWEAKEIDDPKDSLRIAVLEGELGLTLPIDHLWDGIDAQ